MPLAIRLLPHAHVDIQFIYTFLDLQVDIQYDERRLQKGLCQYECRIMYVYLLVYVWYYMYEWVYENLLCLDNYAYLYIRYIVINIM